MDRWEGKVAVVTGSSSGIGAAIAEELVKSGLLVVGLARRLDRLEELSAKLKKAKGKFYARQCDIAKEKDLLDAFKWVNAELGGYDVLVNNAGVVKLKQFLDDDVDSYRKILDTNILAAAISIRDAVASIRSRGVAGHIININSIHGHEVPDPAKVTGTLYTSSKYAVTALTETVRKELSTDPNNKIKITSISPGSTRTEIIKAAGATIGENFYDTIPYLDAKNIADAVLYVLGTPHKVQVTELTIRPINETL